MADRITRKRFLDRAVSALAGAAVAPFALLPASKALAAKGLTFNSAGPITVENREGVWWLITPDGQPFVSLGINHIAPIFLLAPYNREATLRRYGPDFVRPSTRVRDLHGGESRKGTDSDTRPTSVKVKPTDFAACARIAQTFNPKGSAARAWVDQVLADLDDWNFNSLGFGTDLPRPLVAGRVPYVQAIRSVRMAFYLGDGAVVPDVFSQAVEDQIRSAVRRTTDACAADPFLIGYGMSDLPPFAPHDGFGEESITTWDNAIKSQPARTAGKRAWIRLLRTRYTDAPTAARAHGVRAGNWHGLAQVQKWPDPPPAGPAAIDNTSFLSAIADRWYGLHREAIRSQDPHHLIFGDKLYGAAGVPDFLLPILAKHLDVIMIEWFGDFEDQRDTLRRIHQATGKPIFLGDSGFSCPRPRQAHTRGAVCESLEAVGRAYAHYMADSMAEPYIIGWHHCGYIEGWQGLPHWLVASQPGFKDPFEKVHEETVQHVRLANARAHHWHARSR